MEVIETNLKGLMVLKPKVFEDDRGYFFESYNKNLFIQAGLNLEFVQDNQSLSQKGVLRGLHFQNPPHAQGKLVRVITGSVLDVVVDIRKDSKTYGEWYSLELTEKNKWMMYVPPGFAHGFLTLENNTIFSYKCTNFYNKAAEDCLLWNDKDLNIIWNFEKPVLSPKDMEGKTFKSFVSNF
ncbi:MAG: dTDP-4-dehydrorhamnose 3,5-epimerase [Bacteroidota bacterium]|nr:dTDP-4-dehydrorhamnose 3,5-epimerase [Bacteroidota bacterium]MDP3146409.1 dTDP-4-dehydrorhamnose 3,5-epimerase [Bacteroidota bacterium]MDP3557395.1 dTDP-4-dehydrorhamnose 3,5-epimerase [Bacteroidota bacterium]